MILFIPSSVSCSFNSGAMLGNLANINKKSNQNLGCGLRHLKFFGRLSWNLIELWAEVVPCFSVVLILDSLQGIHVKFLATGPQGCHCPPSPTTHCDALCISTQRTAMIQNGCYMFLSDVWCQIMMPLNCSSSQQV